MATEIPMRMVEGNGARKWTSDAANLGPSLSNIAAEELSLLLGGHRLQGNGAASTPNRSGSAPPSMEGSFAALANLLSQQNVNLDPSLASLSNALQNCKSEEQLRSDPAYISYYCSHVNLNPRIPPPLISPENRRLVNHIGGFGNNHKLVSIDDSEARPSHLSGGSLFTHVEEPEDDNKALDGMVKGPIPMFDPTDISSGRHKSLVDLIQEDFPRTPSPVYQSRHSAEEGIDHELQALSLNVSSMDISKISESSLGSIDEIAERCAVDDHPQTSFPTSSSQKLTAKQEGELRCKEAEVGNEASLSGIDASRDGDSGTANKSEEQTYEGNLPLHRNSTLRAPPLQIPVVHGQMIFQGPNHPQGQIERFPPGNPKSSAEGQFAMHSPGPAHPLYTSPGTYVTSNPYYPNLHPQGVFAHQYGIGSYAVGSAILPPYMATYPPHGAFPLPFEATQSPGFNGRTGNVSAGHGIPSGEDLPHTNKIYGQHTVAYQPPFVDPVQLQYLHHTFDDAYGGAVQFAGFPRGSVSGHSNSFASHFEGPIANHMSDQKLQFPANGGVGISNPRKADVMGNNYYGNSPHMGVVTRFPCSPLASPVLPSSPVGGMNPFGRRNEMKFVQGSARTGGMYNSWQGPRGAGSFDDPKRNSFLEELKSSHSRKFELPDIAGRIVEFSVDQHGSRFIQQKLENCTVEEKADVFKEVLPHASKLMTDVFGNYVIQKFFEYGSAAQRKELADQLTGQMLPLSLQMYGCRVIQKALDVIELNQKTQLVLELDGHVMRCVRDQNGNHVIQKCIECLPSDRIGFIISAFRSQVTALSTHPYGCRVIQRVLEHCSDEDQSQCIVDEILESACVLAEDQYGNYVTQHVLERGRPRERAEIISKLTGKIVHLSQHKYASNVVEKCLEYGDAAERELIIEEIIGDSEENDNLLAMMKDQFANYVVQKILEVSSDKHREILLSRIKTHLNALRKYTYGKHIVARFEQLTGEEETQPSESNIG